VAFRTHRAPFWNKLSAGSADDCAPPWFGEAHVRQFNEAANDLLSTRRQRQADCLCFLWEGSPVPGAGPCSVSLGVNMRTSSRRLSLETMEGREVPANVATVMSGGSLFVLGTTVADNVTVSQTAANQVILTPGAGTTIDGSAFPVVRPLFG